MSFIHRKDENNEIARRNEDKKEERRERRDEKLEKRGKIKNEIITRVEMFNKWRFQYQMNYLEYDGKKVMDLVKTRLESINMTNNDKENEEEENRIYKDVEKIIRHEMKRVYKDLSCDIIINSIQVDINELEENEELDTERKKELMNNLITFKDMIEKEIEERKKEEKQLRNLKIDEYIRGKESHANQEWIILLNRTGRENERTEWLKQNEIYEKGIRIYRESMISRALDNDEGEVDDVTKRYIKDLQPKADDRTNDMIEERQEEIKKNRRERRENNIKRKEVIEVTSTDEEILEKEYKDEKKEQQVKEIIEVTSTDEEILEKEYKDEKKEQQVKEIIEVTSNEEERKQFNKDAEEILEKEYKDEKEDNNTRKERKEKREQQVKEIKEEIKRNNLQEINDIEIGDDMEELIERNYGEEIMIKIIEKMKGMNNYDQIKSEISRLIGLYGIEMNIDEMNKLKKYVFKTIKIFLSTIKEYTDNNFTSINVKLKINPKLMNENKTFKTTEEIIKEYDIREYFIFFIEIYISNENYTIENLNNEIASITYVMKKLNEILSELGRIKIDLDFSRQNGDDRQVYELPIERFDVNNMFTDKEKEFWERYEIIQNDEYNKGQTNLSYYLPVLINLNKIRFRCKPINNKYNNVQGNFFPYTLRTGYEILSEYLKRYQIYTEIKAENYTDNCFIHCCKLSGIFKEEELVVMRKMIYGQTITTDGIKSLTEAIDFYCIITVYYDSYQKYQSHGYYQGKRYVKANPPTDVRVLKLISIRYDKVYSHYILDEKTPFRKMFVDNIVEIENNPLYENKSYEWKIEITRRNVKKHEGYNTCYYYSGTNESPYVDSKYLIKKLYDDGAFVKISNEQMNIAFTGMVEMLHNEENYLKAGDIESRLLEYKEEENKEHTLIFADFECFTKEYHKPYCLCYCIEDKPVEYIYGEDCAVIFLNKIKDIKHVIVYFHNLGYDGRLLAKYGVCKIIMKNSKIYQMNIMIGGKKIKFKDSLGMIPDKLSNFHILFDLKDDGEKEIYPYNYYTKETYFKGNIKDVGKDEQPPWNSEQKNQFIENCKRLNILNEETGEFDSKKYCIFYCKRDVNILRYGFLKFRQMTIENIGIDPVGSCTISTLAYKAFNKNAFGNRNIYEYKGCIRDYIRKAIIGGRCMTRMNLPWIINGEIEEKKMDKNRVYIEFKQKKDYKLIADFDACSLYPSAMHRLYLPTGKPKMIIGNNKKYVIEKLMEEKQIEPTEEKYISAFVVTIKITKVGKKRAFPLIMKKEESTNQYVNECTTMIVDHIYLQDLIEYQEIEYEIIEGIYWEGKKDTSLSEYISKIYNLRLEFKKAKNPNQAIYKLLMNSAYGKTIQKPILEDQHFFQNEEKKNVFWDKNYANILYGCQITDDISYVMTRKQVDDFYTPSIIGCLILSMSKRIMNEIMCLAEDLGIEIYYQDTDSMHIFKDDLKRLSEAFKNKYHRELIGNNMGQFHSDFDPVKGKESYAKATIILGKKAYIDLLENEDKEEMAQFRLKGIPKNTLQHYGDEIFKSNLLTLYSYLYQGHTIKFNLLRDNCSFEMTKDLKIHTRTTFEREIKFKKYSKEEKNKIIEKFLC